MSKKGRSIPAKRDPLLQGFSGLVFDNMTADEVIELTDSQKETAFISRYLAEEHPLTRYSEYFKVSVKGEAWELKDLKRYFTQLVTSEKWTEEKFIQVVNSIYRDNQIMSAPSLDARGRMYEQGRLGPNQSDTTSRRRGRI